jgi:site-specific DNA-cytosine methylase
VEKASPGPYLELFARRARFGWDYWGDESRECRQPLLRDRRDGRRTRPRRTQTTSSSASPTRGGAKSSPPAGPDDLLCGGFPCQDLSVAGQRAGLAGDRSGLFFEFARIIDAFRPRWVLVENVPGLLSSNGGRDFGVVLGTLADLGYGVGWRILDSRFFGVPQRRRRVFIVGARADGDPRAAADVPARYSLSARAAQGILRRAEKRGRTLPNEDRGSERSESAQRCEA